MDLVSAAYDAIDSVEMVDNRFAAVIEIVSERLAFGNRVNSSERLDAWIVSTWAHTLLGKLEAADQAASAAVAGLGSGQVPSWVGGASAWRLLGLYVRGRWDEAVAESIRMQRALRESEIRAPWFALNGLLAGYLIARGKGDSVEEEAWRAAALAIFERSDPGIRTQRLRPLFGGDVDELRTTVIADFMVFTGRLDYVALALGELADRRLGADPAHLDAMIQYLEDRSLVFVTAPARRLRGLLRRSEPDLRASLEEYEAMGARPFAARVRAELGLMSGDRGPAESAIADLEQIGDRLQAGRLAAELREGALATAS